VLGTLPGRHSDSSVTSVHAGKAVNVSHPRNRTCQHSRKTTHAKFVFPLQQGNTRGASQLRDKNTVQEILPCAQEILPY
jgi:hypothetical protein